MNSLELKVSSRNLNGNEVWEGTVTVPGLRPAKLVRKSDKTTQFATRSAVTQAARNFAKNIGFEITTSQPTAVAAKRRTTPRTTTQNEN